MIGAIRDRVDRYLGRGRHSIAVPVMDGPLHPNARLEDAPALFALDGIDNLSCSGDDIWCSSGATLLRAAPGGTPQPVDRLEAPISCLAASPSGALAVGLDGTGIAIRGGAHDGRCISELGTAKLVCPTAAVFLDEDTLALCIGTTDLPASDWKRDLMRHGRTGEVWQIDLRSGATEKLAGGLGFAYGICPTPEGLAVSDAWGHRIVLVRKGAPPRELLRHLPGYPARLITGPQGGYVLALFAPRNQLVEFVLREPEFLQVMTEQVHPDNWIAPKLMWGQGFKEPMQGAALKTMGIIKPWAPTWSYGLVVTLDEQFHPTHSYHSRADGTRHGVTSLCLRGGEIIAGAKGAGEAIVLKPLDTGGAQ